MITKIKGNIFESDAEAIVNPVNCDGIMGKGLALEIKKKYPSVFLQYRKFCKSGELVIGKVLLVKTKEEQPKYIINFPTKNHWRNPSEYSYIKLGLGSLKSLLKKYQPKINSIAIPALGCGLGGLKWEEVSKMIEESLKDLDVDIYIFQPS